ncbi:hypothetical protein FDI43_gp37 [Streptomyces phage DrGrey]|uniref:Uncharacterized protein n=4 Tax=Rimavirus drgrey TaxID=2560783 RepID=A0A223LIZ0_9CAUD|nr:hypothetical protein FDI43_gp37 [Streptomyces phage DrGrey]ASU03950.1 hypothetical protein SEA_DRGREY_37 [Streptomyces phage DrGrey]
MRPLPLKIGHPMNEKKNEKFASLKQKIKTYAPSVIAFTAAAASTVLVLNSIKNAAQASEIEVELVPLPEVTGDDKKALLEREDLIVQQSEMDDVYYLSVMNNTNTEN